MGYVQLGWKLYKLIKNARKGKKIGSSVIDFMGDLAELTPTKIDDKVVAQLKSVDKEVPAITNELQEVVSKIWK